MPIWNRLRPRAVALATSTPVRPALPPSASSSSSRSPTSSRDGAPPRGRGCGAGSPPDPEADVGPPGEAGLVEELRRQVGASQAAGAELIVGGFDANGPGWF